MPITRSVTLRPGERVLIPSDAIIKSITTEGGIVVNSDCPLPPPQPFKCYVIRWALADHNNDGNGIDDPPQSDPWEYSDSDGDWNDSHYVGFGYGENYFSRTPLNADFETSILAHIKSRLPSGIILRSGTSSDNDASGRRVTRKIKLMIPEDIGRDLYIKFQVSDYSPVRVYAEPADDCDDLTDAEESFGDVLGTSTTTTTTVAG